MSSCSVVKKKGLENQKVALSRADGRAIYVTWHQRMSFNFHIFGPMHVTMIISQSRDGEYAARTARLLGFKNVRGSSTRGGVRALKSMIERIKDGDSAGVLADGPSGPPRIAKMGAILLARETGVPIIPVLWGADRCWIFNSWDRYMLPKPFARIALLFAEPIWVPESSNKDELEKYRKILEQRLNQGVIWCDKQFGKQRPWRKE